MKIRIAVFGIGMHFQETYTTAFKRPEINDMVEMSWVADLTTKKALVLERCKKAGQFPGFVGVKPFKGNTLPRSLEKILSDQLAKYPVEAILVSTTPEQHHAYTKWALEHKIAVLLDKPITSRHDAVTSPRAARGILDDWESLNTVSKIEKTLLMVNSHRRFHPAYLKVGQLLKEVADKYGFGVTCISSFNSDGQWRLPDELLNIDYHGFNTGNGVLSHFGYHYLDLASSWYKKGTPEASRADYALVNSTFSTASNYAKQITAQDAHRVLVPAGQPAPAEDSLEILEALKGYGEMDSFSSIEMYKGDTMNCHISLQMVHSGFSQRAWTTSAKNLYKENGRVRWENHLIQQGPLHAIEIRSFQAVQPSHLDPKSGLPRWELGGSDQLEINIFRNKLIGAPALQTINMTDLLTEIPENDVIHEDVKAKTFHLFICMVAKQLGALESFELSNDWKKYVDKISEGDEHDLSLIQTHQPTVAFMSAAYESYATRQTKPLNNERIKVNLKW